MGRCGKLPPNFRRKNEKIRLIWKNRLWFAIFAALFAALPLVSVPRIVPVAAPEQGKLTGKTICLDAGHGGYDGGARAKGSGVWEKELNLQVALKTRDCLEAMGAEVIMTRSDDRDLAEAEREGSTKKRRDLNARLRLAQGADLLVSLHMNEYRHPSSSGPQVFYTKGHEPSRLLAGCLQQSLIRTLKPPKERAAQAGDYYILRSPIPSCLVECGFISNPEEEKKLRDPAYQQLIAQAVARGTAAFFELQSRRDVVQ